ncbi:MULTISPECIES: hypothetical protein [Marinomonas]|uniref:Uncharacterized protein n=1 Tax=Marinomonas rhodophyticola TaxID=2992803 RepID=A0ABT3KE61_9GAMM|nr:hypothetical protein [Marinomonas sp. KJ51-3]MCW4628820.1 hypothetical protein [Marinomonas sp. KJ51-3]
MRADNKAIDFPRGGYAANSLTTHIIHVRSRAAKIQTIRHWLGLSPWSISCLGEYFDLGFLAGQYACWYDQHLDCL